MKEIRRTVLALLINVTILYNVERLGVSQSGTVDIAGFVYILEIAAVALIILIPLFWRTRLTLLLLVLFVLYIFGKVLYLDTRPIIGGIHTYLTITEMTLLSSSVLLAQNLARALETFKEAVEDITLADVRKQVRVLGDAQDDIQTELIRSRRHEHPLSVIVVEVDAEGMQANLPQTIYDVQQTMAERYITLRLAQSVSEQLRRTDIVLEYNTQGRFIVFCPETNEQGAQEVMDRIREIATSVLGVPVATGVASFPNEALTIEDLVGRAETNLNTTQMNALEETAPETQPTRDTTTTMV